MKSGIKLLGKQTIIYGLGDTFYKAVAFFLLPVYLKYLDPTQYGLIESLMTTRRLIVILINCGLPQAVFRFYYRAKNEDEKKNIMSTIFFMNLFIIITCTVVILWKNELISNLILKNPEFGFYFAILSVNIFLITFRGIPFSIFRAQKRALAYTVINFTVGLITLIMNIFFIAYLKMGVLGVLYGNLCGSMVGMILISPTIYREIRFQIDVNSLTKIFSYSLPLGFALLPSTLIFMADRYFIIRLSNLHDLGIYALAYKLSNFLRMFIIMPFLLSWGPFVFLKEREENAKDIYSMTFKYFAMIAFAFVVLISVLQIDIIKILAKNPDYHAASRIVPILCYALMLLGLSSVIRGVGIRISGKTYFTTITMVFGLCLNIIMNFILIKQFGIIGASYSLLITSMGIFVMSYVFSIKLYPVNYKIGKLALFFVASLILITLSQVLSTIGIFDNFMVRVLMVLLYFTFLYFTGLSVEERVKLILALKTFVKNSPKKIFSSLSRT